MATVSKIYRDYGRSPVGDELMYYLVVGKHLLCIGHDLEHLDFSNWIYCPVCGIELALKESRNCEMSNHSKNYTCSIRNKIKEID